MTIVRRGLLVAGTIFCAIVGLWLLGILAVGQPASAMPALTPTPSPTATPTTTPIFSATISVEPDRNTLLVGETLTLTVGIDVSEGCQYPIFELSLYQHKSEPQIFEHIDPPADMITGPISIPSVWTFRATGAGTATFQASTFGERYCNDYWNWHYDGGISELVIVDAPFAGRLPLIMR